jgi:phage baseplate assembly protein W
MARVRSAVVRISDTLQTFAARELGDLLRWREVAELNDLAPPWLTPSINEADRIPRTALWGDYLKIPSAATTSSAVVGEDALGADTQMLNGAFVLSDSGDLAIVSGRENLAQALGHRIKTPYKTYLPHPGYGCEIHELLGAPNDATRNLLARGLIRRAMLRDPRAEEASVQAESAGDQLVVSASVQAVEEDTPADLNAVFQLPR